MLKDVRKNKLLRKKPLHWRTKYSNLKEEYEAQLAKMKKEVEELKALKKEENKVERNQAGRI